MYNCSCSCRNNCGALAIIASIIIGVVATVLTITAVITVTPAFLWTTFGIAVGFLAVSLLALSPARPYLRDCLCPILPLFLAGILGTVLTSVILLAITFAATSIAGAIITGLLLTFFSLIITSTACLVKCVAGCDRDID